MIVGKKMCSSIICRKGVLFWPTWGRGARRVRQALDVGLDSFALSYQEERARTQEMAALRQAQGSSAMTVRWAITKKADSANKPNPLYSFAQSAQNVPITFSLPS